MMKKTIIILMWLALNTVQAIAQTNNTLEVWMDKTISITANGTAVTKVTVYQKDPNADYTTFNMVLTVPKGIHVNKVRSGREWINDIELSERATGTHTITCNMPDDRTIKIICMSSELQDLYPDDIDGNPYEPLFTIGIVADQSTYNGKYAVELTGCRFVKNDGNNLSYADLDHVEYSDFIITGGTDFPGVDFTVPAEQCGTLILPFDSDIPEGMSVYECNGISDDNTLLLDRVPSIAANTPYIIAGTAGQYHFNGEYKALLESYSTQYMTGVFEETYAPVGSYVMQNHKNTTGVGFYKVGDTSVKVRPYRCYLNALADGATMFKLALDNLTDINIVKSEANKLVNVYNIDGKIVRSNVKRDKALDNLASGVYIIDNKKIIIE